MVVLKLNVHRVDVHLVACPHFAAAVDDPCFVGLEAALSELGLEFVRHDILRLLELVEVAVVGLGIGEHHPVLARETAPILFDSDLLDAGDFQSKQVALSNSVLRIYSCDTPF